MFLPALLMLQAAAEPCAARVDSGLSGALAGWTAPASTLGVGRVAIVPSKHGGESIEFKVEKAGNYGIALDQTGWIDVVPTAALKTVGYGHSTQCSSIPKLVRFALKPGSYRLQLTKLTNPSAKVMLVAD